MEGFIDLHCHMLPGADDGARDEQAAFSMLDAAHRDGIRSICFTPHCNPYIRPIDAIDLRAVYNRFSLAAKERYPDMRFALGSEIMFYDDCVEDIRKGLCFPLCGGKYLLLEFPVDIEYSEMTRAIGRILSYGYRVMLAHAERYLCLLKRPKLVTALSGEEVLIQLNASLFQKHGAVTGFRKQHFLSTVLSAHIPFVVCTDAHNVESRAPIMSDAYRFICKKTSPLAARQIFIDIPNRLFDAQEPF